MNRANEPGDDPANKGNAEHEASEQNDAPEGPAGNGQDRLVIRPGRSAGTDRNGNRSPAEWDADSYHRVADPQIVWGRRVLARLQLQGNETVLDAGCGTGRVTSVLLERLPQGRVIAVDRSAEMIREATKHLAPLYGDRVSFLRADLEELVLPQRVNAIFSNATFHWILDHLRLFNRLRTVLQPGGRLVAQCGGGPNLDRLLRRVDALIAGPDFAPYFAGWEGPWEFADDVTTAERLRQAGFDDIWTSLEEAPTTLADAATYREFLSTVVLRAHLARLDDRRRDAFLEDLTEQAAADDPPFTLDYWRLNLAGRRPD